MKYFLSRQRYWMAGERVVEIAAGGLDYSGPDMLSDPDGIYGPLGDMLETNDPREALGAAILIRDEWNRHLESGHQCHIEAGYNLDMIMPTEEPTDEQLWEWAQAEWEAAPKCHWCGEAADELPYHIPEFGDDVRFCSEQCADRCWEDYSGK